MTDPADLPPRDIPDDLVVFALIGGPWLARAYFSLRLLACVPTGKPSSPGSLDQPGHAAATARGVGALPYHQHGPDRPRLPVRGGAAGVFMLHCSHFAPLAPPPARPVLVLP